MDGGGGHGGGGDGGFGGGYHHGGGHHHYGDGGGGDGGGSFVPGSRGKRRNGRAWRKDGDLEQNIAIILLMAAFVIVGVFYYFGH
ncbi:MAG TPA: hypothetical protein VJ914_08680 [Pseudonocardiaceae bacterium]|nr:hypothetical protein [Pseudonocardiaceae bacterium]